MFVNCFQYPYWLCKQRMAMCDPLAERTFLICTITCVMLPEAFIAQSDSSCQFHAPFVRCFDSTRRNFYVWLNVAKAALFLFLTGLDANLFSSFILIFIPWLIEQRKPRFGLQQSMFCWFSRPLWWPILFSCQICCAYGNYSITEACWRDFDFIW